MCNIVATREQAAVRVDDRRASRTRVRRRSSNRFRPADGRALVLWRTNASVRGPGTTV